MSHGHAVGGSILLLLTIGGLSYLMLGEKDHPYKLPELGVQDAPAAGHGCQSFDDELRLIQYSFDENDAAASFEFYQFRLDAGVCGFHKKGDRIAVEGKAHHPDPVLDKKMHGMICVRAFGQLRCNWMPAVYVFPDLYRATAD